MKKHPALIVLVAILGLLTAGAGAFTAWALLASPANQIALEALIGDESVEVQMDRWLVFLPKGAASFRTAPATRETTGAEPVGFIFYPGGRIDYRAYAPLARGVAQAGHVAVIVPMPLNLAIFGPDAANDVIATYPMIRHWVIAGHSLGGTVATQYIARNPNAPIVGLVLWGAFASEDISRVPNLATLSISGSRDGLSTPEKIQLNAAKLPRSTRYVEIQGGNHAQFGSYGAQQGDNPADLPAAAQREETIKQTVSFLAALN